MTGIEVGTRIEVGTQIITDGRAAKGWIFAALRESPCQELGAFELPGRDHIPAQVVNVAATGRTVRHDVPGFAGQPLVRVRVTFPQTDGEDIEVGGWVRV